MANETVSVNVKLKADLNESNQMADSFKRIKRDVDQLGSTISELSKQDVSKLASAFQSGSEEVKAIGDELLGVIEKQKQFSKLMDEYRQIEQRIVTGDFSRKQAEKFTKSLDEIEKKVIRFKKETGFGGAGHDKQIRKLMESVESFGEFGETAPLSEAILGKRGDFENTRQQLQSFNADLRDTHRLTKEIGESQSKMSQFIKGIGLGSAAAFGIRQVGAIPSAVGGQFGALGSGIADLATGAVQIGLGGSVGLGSLAFGNVPLAIAGGSMALAGGQQTLSAVTNTIAQIINNAFSGVQIAQELEIQGEQAKRFFKNRGLSLRNLSALGIDPFRNISLRGQLGGLTDNFSESFLELLASYGKATGIGPEQGVMLGGLSKFSGEFGGDFLNRFEKLASQLGMSRGRRPELQQSVNRLGEMFYLQSGVTNPYAPIGAREIVNRIFGESEMSRGGADSFINRMQNSIANPENPAARFFLLEAAGFGKGKSLLDARMMMERGLADPEYFGNVQKLFVERFGGASRSIQTDALKGAFNELQWWEADKLREAFLSGEDFGAFSKRLEAEGKTIDFKKTGVAATTDVERHRVSLQNMIEDAGRQLELSMRKMEKLTTSLSFQTAEKLVPALKKLEDGTMDLTGLFGAFKDIMDPTISKLSETMLPSTFNTFVGRVGQAFEDFFSPEKPVTALRPGVANNRMLPLPRPGMNLNITVNAGDRKINMDKFTRELKRNAPDYINQALENAKDTDPRD